MRQIGRARIVFSKGKKENWHTGESEAKHNLPHIRSNNTQVFSNNGKIGKLSQKNPKGIRRYAAKYSSLLFFIKLKYLRIGPNICAVIIYIYGNIS